MLEDLEEILFHLCHLISSFNMSPHCVHAMSVCRALTLIGDAKHKGKSGPVETRLVVTALLQTFMTSLVPTLHAPPSEKQSGEQSQISLAYFSKLLKTNETSRSVNIT